MQVLSGLCLLVYRLVRAGFFCKSLPHPGTTEDGALVILRRVTAALTAVGVDSGRSLWSAVAAVVGGAEGHL